MLVTSLHAQQSTKAGGLPPASASAGIDTAPGVELDRAVAVVNGDLILESDVEEERRLAVFQPFRDPEGTFSRAEAINRLIDRTLILQQATAQQQEGTPNAEVESQLAVLRKEIPACAREDCASDAGWQRFVSDHGMTMQELFNRWRERIEVFKFIDLRFRMGIHVSESDVKHYYVTVMLPEYAKEKAPAPKLETIAPRIHEVLLQQQVSALLDDWLKSLRVQGSVRILVPGQEAQ